MIKFKNINNYIKPYTLKVQILTNCGRSCALASSLVPDAPADSFSRLGCTPLEQKPFSCPLSFEQTNPGQQSESETQTNPEVNTKE